MKVDDELFKAASEIFNFFFEEGARARMRGKLIKKMKIIKKSNSDASK